MLLGRSPRHCMAQSNQAIVCRLVYNNKLTGVLPPSLQQAKSLSILYVLHLHMASMMMMTTTTNVWCLWHCRMVQNNSFYGPLPDTYNTKMTKLYAVECVAHWSEVDWSEVDWLIDYQWLVGWLRTTTSPRQSLSVYAM
jgi:hypothetical protein